MSVPPEEKRFVARETAAVGVIGSLVADFDGEDLGTLATVVSLVPDLQVCALLLKNCLKRGICFPVETSGELTNLLDRKKLDVGGHSITEHNIGRYLTEELFPIGDARQLAQAIYFGLCRCREDLAWAARAPDHGIAILKHYQELVEQRGGE
jgi:hypothetical protein